MLEIISPYYDSTGYGAASRNTIKAILTATDKLILRPVSFEKDLNIRSAENSEFKKYETKKDGTLVLYQMPAEFVKHNLKSKHAIYTAWETDVIPHRWVEVLNRADYVIAPSTFIAEVFKKSGVKSPIMVINHPVDVELLQTKQESESLSELFKDGVFTFLTIGEFNERKNILALLRAFLYAFGGRDDVRLIIKTFFGVHTQGGEKQLMNVIYQEIKGSKINIAKKQIAVITSKLKREEIAYLHQNSDCYVSFHRGEGYGFPILEATVAGTPVIATGYGGVNEFEGYFNSILYTMEPISNMDFIPWFNGRMMWANPNIDHGIALMEAAVRAGKVKNKMADDAAKRFSYQAIGEVFKRELLSKVNNSGVNSEE